MTLSELMSRAGAICEFCGAADDLAAQAAAPAGDILLCATCRSDAPPAHWRCLEGAAWSAEPAVQFAVWAKLATIDAAWASETRENMSLSEQAQSWADAPADIIHRDSMGTVLQRGDTVVLIKDLTVKGANFTAKRGTAVRKISLVQGNAGQIEGRVEDQKIVILTEFVRKS
jgi:protein PhnA